MGRKLDVELYAAITKALTEQLPQTEAWQERDPSRPGSRRITQQEPEDAAADVPLPAKIKRDIANQYRVSAKTVQRVEKARRDFLAGKPQDAAHKTAIMEGIAAYLAAEGLK